VFTILLEEQTVAGKRESTEKLMFLIYSIYKLIIVQRDATQSSLFVVLQVHATYFGCQHPSSSVHKTVTTAYVTGYIFRAAISLQSDQFGRVGGR
jgi:hypothetical protein